MSWALIKAALEGNIHNVATLLSSNPTLLTQPVQPPFPDYFEKFSEFVRTGDDPNIAEDVIGLLALRIALAFEHCEIAVLLLNACRPINAVNHFSIGSDKEPIMHALSALIESNNHSFIANIIAHCQQLGADINIQNEAKNTALTTALRNKNLNVFKVLLHAKTIDLTLRNEEGTIIDQTLAEPNQNTAFFAAVVEKVTGSYRDAKGETLLTMLVKRNPRTNISKFIRLLNKNKVNLRAYDCNGQHAMFIAATQNNYSSMRQLKLLDRDLPNFPLESKLTPVATAIATKDFRTAQRLIELGATFQVSDINKEFSIEDNRQIKQLQTLSEIVKQPDFDLDQYHHQQILLVLKNRDLAELKQWVTFRSDFFWHPNGSLNTTYINQLLLAMINEPLAAIGLLEYLYQFYNDNISLKLVLKNASQLFETAVCAGNTKIIGFLHDQHQEELPVILDNACSLAIKKQQFHLLRLLYNYQCEAQSSKNLCTLDLIPSNSNTVVFDDANTHKVHKILSPKAAAFLLSQTLRDKNIFVIVNNNEEKNYRQLHECLNLFIQASTEAEMYVFYNTNDKIPVYQSHCIAFRCERNKENPKTIHIIIMDCLIDITSTKMSYCFLKEKLNSKNYPAYHFTINCSVSKQYSEEYSCNNLAVFNLIQHPQSLYPKIAPWKDLPKTSISEDVFFCPLAPEFMRVSNSFKKIGFYIASMLEQLKDANPDTLFYQDTIKALDRLFSDAFAPRQLITADGKVLTSPIEIENEKYSDKLAESSFEISSIANALPKKTDAKHKSKTIFYPDLDVFIRNTAKKSIKNHFLTYLASFKTVYLNRSAQILRYQQAALANTTYNNFSLLETGTLMRRMNPSLYDVSSGKLVLNQEKAKQQQLKESKQFQAMQTMALMTWVLSDTKRRNHFEKSAHAGNFTEKNIMTVFGKEILAEAYAPFPADYFSTYFTHIESLTVDVEMKVDNTASTVTLSATPLAKPQKRPLDTTNDPVTAKKAKLEESKKRGSNSESLQGFSGTLFPSTAVSDGARNASQKNPRPIAPFVLAQSSPQ